MLLSCRFPSMYTRQTTIDRKRRTSREQECRALAKYSSNYKHTKLEEGVISTDRRDRTIIIRIKLRHSRAPKLHDLKRTQIHHNPNMRRVGIKHQIRQPSISSRHGSSMIKQSSSVPGSPRSTVEVIGTVPEGRPVDPSDECGTVRVCRVVTAGFGAGAGGDAGPAGAALGVGDGLAGVMGPESGGGEAGAGFGDTAWGGGGSGAGGTDGGSIREIL